MSEDPSPQKRHQRHVVSYLIDPRFQLKYTGLLVGVVLVVTLLLGTIIWRTSDSAAENARFASAQAETAIKESETTGKLLRLMGASYAAQDPELAKTLDVDEAATDAKFAANRAEVERRKQEVETQQRRIRLTLIGGSLAFLVLLTGLGIYITHRIVGPVYRLKRLLRQVGTARFAVVDGMGRGRRGDELEDLFDTFVQMTYSLKALQAGRLATLEATIERARKEGVPESVMQGLTALEGQIALGLGGEVDSFRPGTVAPKPRADAKAEEKAEAKDGDA